MSLKFTILGCGSSAGVPRIGGNWGACDPANPKNRRRRCSLLCEKNGAEGTTAILIDTTPDVREQLLDADVYWLDAVFFTHDHADHTHGIDDLRVVTFNGRRKVDVYFDKRTRKVLHDRFGYCFKQPAGSPYPPILKAHDLWVGEKVTVDGAGGQVEVLPFPQIHGDIESIGFRLGNLAYSSDVSDLSEDALPFLQNLDVWIVDALRYSSHPSHFSVSEALEWIEKVNPKRAVLTHLHIDLDYNVLASELPNGVEPAYDGMVIKL